MQNTQQLCNTMVDMLNENIFLTKIFWINVVKGINHSYQGNSKGLELLINCTKSYLNGIQIPKFYESNIEETCKTFYERHKTNDIITLKTLAWYAKFCHKEKYCQWHKEWCLSEFKNPEFTKENFIAAIQKYFWLDLICLDVESFSWCSFEHRWIKRNNNREEFILFIQYHFMNFIESNMINEPNFEEIKNMILNIDSCIEELAILFYEKKCQLILDTNPLITRLNNGVIENYQNELIFRKMKPEDYVLLSTGIDYVKSYSFQNEEVKKCAKYFSGFFSTEDLSNFYEICCSGLTQPNKKIFCNWIGENNNAKKICIELLKSIYGHYFFEYNAENFPIEFLRCMYGPYIFEFPKNEEKNKEKKIARFVTIEYDIVDGNDIINKIALEKINEEHNTNTNLIILSSSPVKIEEDGYQRINIFFKDNNASEIKYETNFPKIFFWLMCKFFNFYYKEF